MSTVHASGPDQWANIAVCTALRGRAGASPAEKFAIHELGKLANTRGQSEDARRYLSMAAVQGTELGGGGARSWSGRFHARCEELRPQLSAAADGVGDRGDPGRRASARPRRASARGSEPALRWWRSWKTTNGARQRSARGHSTAPTASDAHDASGHPMPCRATTVVAALVPSATSFVREN